MYRLWDIREIKCILKKHGFSFSKSLGQNFIIDPEVCPAIVACAGITPQDCVLEIGPGIGVLSAELCKNAKKVVAVELDKRLPAVLADTLADFENFRLVEGDILKIDIDTLIKEHFPDATRIKVCANLPYYITSPVLLRLLEGGYPIESITVMVQKEAGERICAAVGSKAAGALTVAVGYRAEAQEAFFVPKESFLPAPKVDSEVIRLVLRKESPVKTDNEALFFKVVRAAFSERRKTAANSLSAGLSLPKSDITALLTRLGFAENARAENFTMEDFAIITNALQKEQWNSF